ncbi:hypothetical protein BKP56_09120 [Marinilactibacillus sp. 15R]|uniref:conserved phage C-terminal domain-containing protein n=1 Tax=Marinilactibacillus sp. 15R TaxID=1911586 RepID=UPI00090B7ABD|nr:conserved phage C-terminal domain-containing protein [Marinilactibacillus sp. 15R]API89404.1 hypothetical protein BKP56_09120 [Marinilactibacillus sp. 15R]
MAIRRAKRKTNFTIISNVGLRDSSLSLKAKGLLAYMLSLPDDWVFYETELVKHSIDGKASVRSGLRELEGNGYLIKQQERSSDGKFQNVDWVLHDEPWTDFRSTDKRSTEEPTTDKRSTENQPLLNTDSTKDLNIPNTDNTKDIMSGKPNDASIPYQEIITYLNEKANRNYKDTTPKTRNLIKARWKEGFSLEDFKTVVDNQVSEWQKDKYWNKFLRPETLFGTKFEGYLNKPKQKAPGVKTRKWE